MQKLLVDYAQTGAWVVSTYKSICGFNLNEPVFGSYETIILAAKAAMLLSPIRKLDVVRSFDFEIYRKIAGLKPRECIEVMKILEKLDEVQIKWDYDIKSEVPISAIRVKNTEKVDVLTATGKLFAELNPTSNAKIAIIILQETLKVPIPKEILINLITSGGFEEESINRTLTHLLAFGLVSETRDIESGSPLIYNPNAFQSNAEDVFAAIKGLNNADRESAMDILEFVKGNPGIPINPKFDQSIVNLLIKCGLIDSSAIITKKGKENYEFTTAPYIWGALGLGDLGTDVLDDAKLLLNCLRFGQLYSVSHRGKINDPHVLVSALIAKGGVGPATAIGEDYPMPLARGIVSIVESKLNAGRYFMELRKNDVAEAVKEVLEEHGPLPTPIRDEEVAQKLKQQGEFVSYEQLRVKKTLPPELIEERDSLAFSLRTHRKGR
ncbi:hypothetical protein [Paenibacillus odorifer]|uniref:hypothetical protein n=1 Tax=Paenibacillus TaxID=44249 RepID=UPI00096F2D0E|nr:hypothetical protein [Paenibacillus odorifer]OMC97125.1 hypothetical protein BJP46_26860 [Paenibacillus odorifer]